MQSIAGELTGVNKETIRYTNGLNRLRQNKNKPGRSGKSDQLYWLSGGELIPEEPDGVRMRAQILSAFGDSTRIFIQPIIKNQHFLIHTICQN